MYLVVLGRRVNKLQQDLANSMLRSMTNVYLTLNSIIKKLLFIGPP